MGVSLLLLVSCIALHAQVGVITNNSNKDAVLDLSENSANATKGLLLPKVKLTSLSSPLPLSAHVEGMYVYNTDTAGSGTNQVTPGEYSNDGTKWIRLQTITSWDLNTNAATVPTANFIGTINASDLIIKANSLENMRISSTDGSVGIGRTTGPTASEGNPKLIIDNGTTAGAIQIKDGTQGEGYILISDANGVGRWVNSAVASGLGLYKNTIAQTYPADVSTLIQTNQPINVITNGNYTASIRWFGACDGFSAGSHTTSAYFELYKNGIKVDEIEFYTGIFSHNSRFSFLVDLYAPNCLAGDILTIKLKPSIGNGLRNWYSGKSGTLASQMPSIIVFKT